VATEPATRTALLLREPLTATTTLLRVVIDDLIDLILGLELTPRATMPRLATRLAPQTFLARQLLRLRSRFRSALLPRLRWIRRRRLGTRARVLPCLLLQPLQAIRVLPNLGSETNNELDTRLTPRVINRLRLRTLHDRKIRCTLQESLPTAPTTERLHLR
jgi:hypothetical protein